MAQVVSERSGTSQYGSRYAYCRQNECCDPDPLRELGSTLFHVSIALQREVKGSVERQGRQGEQTAKNGVPVKDAGIESGAAVGPERKKEVVVGAYRNAADDVPRAAPKKMASRALEKEKSPSKNDRQSGAESGREARC